MVTAKEYEVDVRGLATAVAECVPSPGHSLALQFLRRFDCLHDARLVTARGGVGFCRAVRPSVLTYEGALVHRNHAAWLEAEVACDDGDVQATMLRLRKQKYRLSARHITKLYFAAPATPVQYQLTSRVSVDRPLSGTARAFVQGEFLTVPGHPHQRFRWQLYD